MYGLVCESSAVHRLPSIVLKMSILKNFVNPWESTGELGSQALGTEVLEGNVVDLVSRNKRISINENGGFKVGKELVEKVYATAKSKMEEIRDRVIEISKRIAEIYKALEILTDSETDVEKKEVLETEKDEITSERNLLGKQGSEFQSAVREIDEMKKANIIFNIMPTLSAYGEAKFDGYQDGLPVIGLYYHTENILDKVPLVAHELKHGHQFMLGEIAFDANQAGRAVMIYDIVNEIEAFQREAAFAGGEMKKGNKIFSVQERPKPNDIAGLLGSYEKVYDRLGDNKITIYTKFKVITEKGQDAIFYGDTLKITESEIEFDNIFRDSDFQVRQCLEKYTNIIYHEK